MRISRKSLCIVYAAIAVFALVGTWSNVVDLLRDHGFVQGTLRFWQGALASDVSRFLSIDLLFLGLSVVVWMVLEARRLGIPGVWLYVLAGLLVAISVTVPLFLIHRELKLAQREPGQPAGAMTVADATGLVALGVAFAAFAVAARLG